MHVSLFVLKRKIKQSQAHVYCMSLCVAHGLPTASQPVRQCMALCLASSHLRVHELTKRALQKVSLRVFADADARAHVRADERVHVADGESTSSRPSRSAMSVDTRM